MSTTMPVTARGRRAAGRLTAVACAGTLLAAGCMNAGEGGVPGVAIATEDDPAAVAVVADDTAARAEAGTAVQIDNRPVVATVVYEELEYRFGTVSTARSQHDGMVAQAGPTVVVAFEITNPTDKPAAPARAFALDWGDADGNPAGEVAGTVDVERVPAGGSSTAAVAFTLPERAATLVDEAERYDEDTARVIVGQGGRATAQVPLGPSAELVTRQDVAQTHLTGEAFEAGPVTLTVDDARVWYSGTGRSQTLDDQALFEITFTMHNNGDQRFCTPRGQGSALSLTRDDGATVVDLGLTERCVGGGRSVETTTGFVLDADYPDDYTLTLDRRRVEGREFTGELEFEITDRIAAGDQRKAGS